MRQITNRTLQRTRNSPETGKRPNGIGQYRAQQQNHRHLRISSEFRNLYVYVSTRQFKLLTDNHQEE
jgi:hypothetical protein